MGDTATKKRSKLAAARPGREFGMKAFHNEMQALRQAAEDVTFKSFLAETYGAEYTPEMFYAETGTDLSKMTVHKMLNTSELNKYLFPEIFRDAIITGLEYAPFWSQLVTSDEPVESTGLTMPSMDFTGEDADEVRLRDVNEGATIPEGEIITWSQKSVTISKKARGLKQTYESIMYTPINLAAVYFQELGQRLGADLDADLILVLLNGDQADLSQSAPVIGASTANTLVYRDISRAWMRFKRLGRTSTYLLGDEADILSIMDMAEFQRTRIPNGVTPSGVTLNVSNPLPTSQNLLVHDGVPTKKLLFIDTTRAAVKLTAMPLLIESEKMISRQLQGEYISIITGFANIFRDGRLVLDYSTNLGTNPGPTPLS
jgi:hypothetical protein